MGIAPSRRTFCLRLPGETGKAFDVFGLGAESRHEGAYEGESLPHKSQAQRLGTGRNARSLIGHDQLPRDGRSKGMLKGWERAR